MRFLCFCFFISSQLLSLSLYAQTTIQVLNAQDKQPLSQAHLMYRSDGVTKGVFLYADKNGFITIPSSTVGNDLPDRYFITISFVGFETIQDTIAPRGNYEYRMKEDAVLLSSPVITAQYAPNSIEKAVQNIKIIDRKQIADMGAVNLRDVMRQQNNIRLSQDQILGSSVSMQGVSGQNVKILIDGVPIIGRQGGNLDLSQVNLNNVERIEIVEGPLSVNYGSNALAGTINIITVKETKTNWDGSVQYYQESVGQYNADGKMSWRKGSQQIDLTGGRNYFDGWNTDDSFIRWNKSERADSGRTREWNPKEQYFFDAAYQLKRGETTVRPFVRWFDEKITNRGNPRAPYQEIAFDDYYYTRRFDKGLMINSKLQKDRNFQFVFSFNEYRRIKNTYLVDLTTLQKQLTENAEDQDTSKFHLWMSRASITTKRLSDQLNYEIGYDINVEKATGKRIDEGEQWIEDYAIYSSMEYQPLDELTIRPGVRYSYNSVYDAPVTPSLHIRYKHKKITTRASYARGFRAPSLKELYFDFVDINHNIIGNTDLKAERSHNYQINFAWNNDRLKLLRKVAIGSFYNDITDLIFLGQRPGSVEFTYLNIGKHRTLGFNGNLELKYKNVSFSPGLAYVGRYNAISEETPVEAFSYSPEVNARSEYVFRKLKMNLNTFYKYTGELPGFFIAEDDQIVKTRIEDYHMLELSLTKRMWEEKISLTVGGKNMFDVRNINSNSSGGGVHSASSGSVPIAWGRSVFIRVKLNLVR